MSGGAQRSLAARAGTHPLADERAGDDERHVRHVTPRQGLVRLRVKRRGAQLPQRGEAQDTLRCPALPRTCMAADIAALRPKYRVRGASRVRASRHVGGGRSGIPDWHLIVSGGLPKSPCPIPLSPARLASGLLAAGRARPTLRLWSRSLGFLGQGGCASASAVLPFAAPLLVLPDCQQPTTAHVRR